MIKVADGEKKFVSVGSLKIGGYVLIDGEPCQIKTTEKSKPGKHGSAKARITATNIFTGQKRNLLKATSAEAEVPIIIKASGQVVAVMGNQVQIMNVENYEQYLSEKPKEFAVKGGDEVEYHQWGGQIRIVRKRG